MPVHSNLYPPERRETFLDDVEQFAGRKFRCRRKIEYILLYAEQSGAAVPLDDLLFIAKFVSNAHSVLKRVGAGSDGTENLVQEYSKNLKRSADILRTLLPAEPDPVSEKLRTELLEQSESGLDRLLNFLYEVSWIKNYLLDTKRQGT